MIGDIRHLVTPDRFTPRELEVVMLVAQGIERSEVASILGVSTKTYDTHRVHASKKLNSNSGGLFARWAIHHGLLDTITGQTTAAWQKVIAAARQRNLERGITPRAA